MRCFDLGAILSVTTGLFVSPAGIGAVHELLDYMTGDTLLTHQLPRAIDECRPAILAQYPDLADVPTPGEFSDGGEVCAWLDEQAARFGESRELAPLAPEDHARIDPLTELAMMAPNMPVSVVRVDWAP